jgi:hypothetical protein
MSDDWIALIPEDPRHVPHAIKRRRALERFLELAPNAENIEIKVSDNIQFFDCGANFIRITCPNCRVEISMEWWRNRMDEDYVEEGFALMSYPTPCCNAPHTLNELIYEWPQGFGRFALDVMNPSIGQLRHEVIAEFEKILGTRLRVIHQHI